MKTLLFCILLLNSSVLMAETCVFIAGANYLSITDDDTNSALRGHWYALVKSKKQWSLLPTKLKVSVDNNTDEKIPFVDSNVKNAVYLLKANNLKPGPVLIVGGNVLKPDSQLDACANNAYGVCQSKYSLNSTGYQVAIKRIGYRETPEISIENRWQFSLKKFDDLGHSQVIRKEWRGTEQSYRLDIAGDLDGDGLLDLVFSYPDSEGPDHFLFLSTEAKESQLVGEAKPCHKRRYE